MCKFMFSVGGSVETGFFVSKLKVDSDHLKFYYKRQEIRARALKKLLKVEFVKIRTFVSIDNWQIKLKLDKDVTIYFDGEQVDIPYNSLYPEDFDSILEDLQVFVHRGWMLPANADKEVDYYTETGMSCFIRDRFFKRNLKDKQKSGDIKCWSLVRS